MSTRSPPPARSPRASAPRVGTERVQHLDAPLVSPSVMKKTSAPSACWRSRPRAAAHAEGDTAIGSCVARCGERQRNTTLAAPAPSSPAKQQVEQRGRRESIRSPQATKRATWLAASSRATPRRSSIAVATMARVPDTGSSTSRPAPRARAGRGAGRARAARCRRTRPRRARRGQLLYVGAGGLEATLGIGEASTRKYVHGMRL